MSTALRAPTEIEFKQGIGQSVVISQKWAIGLVNEIKRDYIDYYVWNLISLTILKNIAHSSGHRYTI